MARLFLKPVSGEWRGGGRAWRGIFARRAEAGGVARADLAALTSWRSKLALVREHVCPPIAYMRTKYPVPADLLPLAYLHRIVRGAPRWFER